MNQITEVKDITVAKSSSQFSGSAHGLSYYIHDHSQSFRLELFGALTAEEIVDLDGCWRTAESSVAGRKVRIDLRGVSAIDSAGRKWLAKMAKIEGAEFVTSSEISGDLPETAVRVPESPAKEPSSSWCRRLRALVGTGPAASATSAPADASSEKKGLALKAERQQVSAA